MRQFAVLFLARSYLAGLATVNAFPTSVKAYYTHVAWTMPSTVASPLPRHEWLGPIETPTRTSPDLGESPIKPMETAFVTELPMLGKRDFTSVSCGYLTGNSSKFLQHDVPVVSQLIQL